jgi:Mg/Co/Ni transporter MgtE
LVPLSKEQEGLITTITTTTMKTSHVRLRKVLPFLQVLRELRPGQRSILLSHLDDESCEMVYEAVANVLKNSKVTAAKRRRLKKALEPHKKCLRTLISKKSSKSTKRKNLAAVGGFPIGTILATALPILLDLFTKK